MKFHIDPSLGRPLNGQMKKIGMPLKKNVLNHLYVFTAGCSIVIREATVNESLSTFTIQDLMVNAYKLAKN